MSTQKHIVGFAAQAWGKLPLSVCMTSTDTDSWLGHTRPLVNLCARLAKLQPDVYVTLLVSHSFCDRIKGELARSFDSPEENAAKRVR